MKSIEEEAILVPLLARLYSTNIHEKIEEKKREEMINDSVSLYLEGNEIY